ncbi:MAG: lysyl oxidase family protein [Nocardioidaceae bacterium]
MGRRTITVWAVAVALVTATVVGVTVGASGPGASSEPGHATKVDGSVAAPMGAAATGSDPDDVRATIGPRLLRPDMRSLRARDIQIRSTRARRQLRFAARLANDGRGPLLLRPKRQRQCPRGQHRAVQVLHRDRAGDGVFQRRQDRPARAFDAGCMLSHPTHDHWHFDAMASYSLVHRDGATVSRRPKVSFCLRDNRPLDRRVRQRREYFGECSRRTRQGISPGWLDLYDVDTPGQSLRLPRRMPDGVYCLVLRADPRDQLIEGNERDNTAARAVRIRGLRVSTPSTGACRGLGR